MSQFIFVFVLILNFLKLSKANFICPESNGLFPDPSNCENFYECDKFSPYLKPCGSNLHFNPIQKYCDWPEGANCQISDSHRNTITSTRLPILSTKNTISSSIIIITKKPKKKTKSSTQHTTKLITQSTTRYTTQSTNKLTTQSTTRYTSPSTNKYTTLQTKKTIKPEETTTPKLYCEFCFKCPQPNGYFENTLDKYTYYHCFKNESFLMYCPRNYIWIQVEQICNEEEENLLIDARIKPKTSN